jgi:hypothetical protein
MTRACRSAAQLEALTSLKYFDPRPWQQRTTGHEWEDSVDEAPRDVPGVPRLSLGGALSQEQQRQQQEAERERDAFQRVRRSVCRTQAPCSWSYAPCLSADQVPLSRLCTNKPPAGAAP